MNEVETLMGIVLLGAVAGKILSMLNLGSGQVRQGTDAKKKRARVERRYQQQPYMKEGMYCVGTRPKSLGEGVVIEAYTHVYAIAWKYWDDNAHKVLVIYKWKSGSLVKVGVRRRNPKTGFVYYVPLPPDHMATA